MTKDCKTTKTLYILRGISGSGKSTKARKIQDDTGAVIFSSDDFFITGGEYIFDGDLLHLAHAWNRGRLVRAMRVGQDIILDSTNTRAWEYEPYLKHAEHFGYNVNIVPVHGKLKVEELEIIKKRNVHKVPAEVVQAQYDRFEF